MSRLSGNRHCFLGLPVFVGVLLVTSCGGKDGGTPTPTPTPQTAKIPALITWGQTRLMMYGSPLSGKCDDLLMFRNFLRALGQKEQGLKILYTADTNCDPRTDPKYCGWTSNLSYFTAFFQMIDQIGTIEFHPLSAVDASTYDVVIADWCLANITSAQQATLQSIVNGTRGGVLVAACNSCRRPEATTAQLANAFVQKYGIIFSNEDPEVWDCFPIPAQNRTGLLKDVTSVYIFRVVPQAAVAPARSIFVNTAGQTLAAVYERP